MPHLPCKGWIENLMNQGYSACGNVLRMGFRKWGGMGDHLVPLNAKVLMPRLLSSLEGCVACG